jgi:hypothetical protein
VNGWTLEVHSASLANDTQVPAVDISSSQVFLTPVTFLVPAGKWITLIASIRWFPSNPSTASGLRVAYLQVDGQDVGPLIIGNAIPGGLDQFSTGASYSVVLAGGTHTFRIHFGTCCGSATPFVVGNESRLDVVY